MIIKAVLLTITKNSSVGVKCSVGIDQRLRGSAMNTLFMSVNDKKYNKYSHYNKNYISVLRSNSYLPFKPPKKKILSSKIDYRSIAKNDRYRKILPFFNIIFINFTYFGLLNPLFSE